MSERMKPSTSPAGNAKVVALRQSEQPDNEATDYEAPGAVLSAEQQAKALADLYRGSRVLEVPPTKWLLPGVLPKRALGALYAAPGAGKSHIAVHLAFEAATGGQFFGEKFERPLRVLYVAAERPTEVRDRFEAQAALRGIEMPATLALHAARRPLQIGAIPDFEALRFVVASAFDGERPDLLIFDTFARMTLGQEENAAKDMGPAIEAFGALVTECGEAFGLLIHHSGKDATRGLRGSSALLGALDVVLRLDGNPAGLSLSVEKINAGPSPMPAHFRVMSQAIPDPTDLGTDGARTLRNVGVAVPASFAEVAAGLEAEVLEVMRDLGEAASAKTVTEAYNEGRKPGETKSLTSITRALRHLAEARPPSVVLEGKGPRARWRLVEAPKPAGLEGLEG